MSSTLIQMIYETQQCLGASGVASVVTGSIAMNYYGVDVVVHDIEVCVPAKQARLASWALEARSDLYELLPSIQQPDFYHPFKTGAACFRFRTLEGGLQLHLLADTALCLDVAAQPVHTGLQLDQARPELKDLCVPNDETALAHIAWPTLEALLNGYLRLAVQYSGSEEEIILLMHAERLIDANEIDQDWCDLRLNDKAIGLLAMQLQLGKKHRQEQSDWV
ncbi:hypothetical protein D0864_01796 [Hortaea werneckii]|uniref:Uncharacterized protein n=1 Tax=Hortaea werneckii TaxID=91943 RepID=A0A3M7H588_HORWE|nr:hypothetical protein D0864_01796 [Hortaea werneckii]